MKQHTHHVHGEDAPFPTDTEGLPEAVPSTSARRSESAPRQSPVTMPRT